jgi:hypothetical protein
MNSFALGLLALLVSIRDSRRSLLIYTSRIRIDLGDVRIHEVPINTSNILESVVRVERRPLSGLGYLSPQLGMLNLNHKSLSVRNQTVHR